jgi:hypothetical protein
MEGAARFFITSKNNLLFNKDFVFIMDLSNAPKLFGFSYDGASKN